jgi:hypothetical protein
LRPGGNDRRGKPLPLIGISIDTVIVDPWRCASWPSQT